MEAVAGTVEIKKRETFGLAVAGFGQNLIFGFWSSYMMKFHTDILGITAAAAGLIVMFTRLFDAVNDPLSGLIVDRTRSRWGRYRPWLLIGPLPIVVIFVLCFTAPGIGTVGKVVYAAVTYVLMSTFFDFVDVPFWSLPSAMTMDTTKRGGIFSAMRISTTLGSLVIGVVAVPLITALGGSETLNSRGFLLTAIVLGVFAMACYFTGFFLVREHIKPMQQEEFKLSAIINVVVKNKPLMLIVLSFILVNTANYARSAIGLYFTEINLGDIQLTPIFSILALPGMLIGMVITPLLMKKIDKKTLYIATCLVGALMYIAYFFAGYQNLTLVMVFSAILPIPLGVTGILVSTLISSTIEYAELKTGQRREGLISSTQTFSAKVCIAVGGGIGGLLLTISNYVPNQPATQLTKDVLMFSNSLLPAILLVLGTIPAFFFELTNKRHAELVAQLEERRKEAGTQADDTQD